MVIGVNAKRPAGQSLPGRPVFRLVTSNLPGTLGGTRTPNLLVRSQTLYPLSYEGVCDPCALKYTSQILPH